MTWARIDDAILDNPKIARVGPIGFALHVAAITYCARNLTDGFLPFGHSHTVLSTAWIEGEEEQTDGHIWSLAAVSGMKGEDGPELIKRMVDMLVAAELWEIVPGGYRVHDFLDYNPSREQVLAEREAARKRQDKRRHGVSHGVTAPVTTGVNSDHPVPIPREAKASTPKPPKGAVSADVELVFTTWVNSTGRKACKLDESRKRVIRARFAEGFSLDDLCAAVQGWERDPWEGRRQQNELKILLRSASQVEKFRDLWRQVRVAPELHIHPSQRAPELGPVRVYEPETLAAIAAVSESMRVATP